jgi:phosphate-selective porin OprO/OprP
VPADEIASLKARIEALEKGQVSSLALPAGSDKGLGTGGEPAPDVWAIPSAPCGDAGTAASANEALLKAEWKNGLLLSSPDDAFQIHIGGRTQFDIGWNGAPKSVQFGPGGTGELSDGADFRRATLRIDGTMYRILDWVVEYDFANNTLNDNSPGAQPIGTPGFTEVSATLKDLPYVGRIKMGYFDEPIGLTTLNSSRNLSFMERAPGIGSLYATSPGAMMYNWSADERVTWAAGAFHTTNNSFGFGVGDGQYAYTGRTTWLPWYEDDGRELLHLGIGASHRHWANDQVELRGRPSVRTAPGPILPSLASTGTIDSPDGNVFDLELAVNYGSWSLQAEYFGVSINDAVVPDNPGNQLGTLFYQGAYVELTYFLTGEYRPYDRTRGIFGRVIPNRNFDAGDWSQWLMFPGAWEVGVRYAYLDLQDKGVNGGTLNDITLGLNWLLNPNAKIQWNLAIDHRSSTPPGSSGWTYIFGSRMDFDF